VWEHPHNSTSSSILFSASHHIKVLSRSLYLCVQSPITKHLNRSNFRAPTNGTNSASHAYQLRQIANGKAEQTAELNITDASLTKRQEPNCELWLAVSWRGKTTSTTTRQLLTLNEGWPCSLTRKPRSGGAGRPVDANARDGQVD